MFAKGQGMRGRKGWIIARVSLPAGCILVLAALASAAHAGGAITIDNRSPRAIKAAAPGGVR